MSNTQTLAVYLERAEKVKARLDKVLPMIFKGTKVTTVVISDSVEVRMTVGAYGQYESMIGSHPDPVVVADRMVIEMVRNMLWHMK